MRNKHANLEKLALFGLFLVCSLWCLTSLETIFQRMYEMSSFVSIPLYVFHDSLIYTDYSNYIWSIYLSVDPIFKSLWFLS